ncbi:MAG: hydrolase [Candidatus Shapirobacteria bacterium]
MNNQNTECCPKFNPKLWDGKVFEWKNKRFIKDKVFTLFYIPMNFGTAMTRSFKKIENSGQNILEGLVLSEHTSKWNMNLYLAVNKEIVGTENIILSGKFLSKVYEGDYKDMGKWTKDFESYIKTKKMIMKKMYMWYTTCPKCAKKYGKNYVVFLAEI